MTGTGAGGRARHPALDAAGWVAAARRIASPNRDARPPGTAITLAVVHGISLPPGEFGGPGIVDLFTNRLDPAAHPYYAGIAHLRVSAHFLVRRRGELLQFVALHRARLARRGVDLEGPRRLQRLLDRHRARGHRRPAVYRGAVCPPRPPAAAAAPPLPAGRPGRAQRRRAWAQDRPGAGLRLAAPARPPRCRLTPGVPTGSPSPLPAPTSLGQQKAC